MKNIYSLFLCLILVSMTVVSQAGDDGDKKSKRKLKKNHSTSTEINGNYKHQYAQNTTQQSATKVEHETIDQNYKHQGVIHTDHKSTQNNTSTKKLVQKKNHVSYKHQFGL